MSRWTRRKSGLLVPDMTRRALLGGVASLALDATPAGAATRRCADLICGKRVAVNTTGGRPNLFNCSNSFTAGAWEKFNGAAVADNHDGTFTLTLVAAISNGIDQNITASGSASWQPSTTYTFSVDLQGSGQKCALQWNPGGGSSGAVVSSGDITLTGSLVNHALTFTTPATLGSGGNTPNIGIVSDAANDAATIVMRHAKIEIGGSATAYGSDTFCPAAPAIQAPPQIAQSSPVLVFNDEFTYPTTADFLTHVSFNANASGFKWWAGNFFDPAGTVTSSQFAVDGTSTLTMTGNGNKCELISVAHNGSSGFSKALGYYEWRVKFNIDANPNMVGEFYGMALDHISGANADGHFVEVDFFESFGNGEFNNATWEHFDPQPNAADVHNSNSFQSTSNNWNAQFNTFGCWWRNDGTVRFYLNNSLFNTVTPASQGVPGWANVQNDPCGFIIGFWPNGAIGAAQLQCDFVRIWQTSLG